MKVKMELRKWFIISSSLLCMSAIGFRAIAQQKSIVIDKTNAQHLQSNLKDVFLSIHSKAKQGELTVYVNDSLEKEMTVNLFNMNFGNIDVDKAYRGMMGVMEIENYAEPDLTREIRSVAPKFEFMVGGRSMGIHPMYYTKVKDLKKVLDENDFTRLITLIGFADKSAKNNAQFPEQMAVLNEGEKLTISKKLDSRRLSEYATGRVNVDLNHTEMASIYQAAYNALLHAIKMDVVSQNASYTVYSDKALNEEIENPSRHDDFSEKVKIYVPDRKHPGEFSDSMVYKWPSFENLMQIDFTEKTALLKFEEGYEFYMRRKDFDKAIPEWILLILDAKEA